MRYLGSFFITLILYSSLLFAISYSSYYSFLDKSDKEQIRSVRIALVEPPKVEQPKVLKKPKKKIEEKKIVKKPKKKEKKRIVKQTPKKDIKPTPNKALVEEKICEVEEEVIEQLPKQQPQLLVEKSTTINKTHIKNRFLEKVKSRINQNKIYPNIAKRRGIQGYTKVSFEIAKNGNVENIKLLEGNEIFKKAVFNAINESFPIKIPTDLDIFPLTISLRIEFKLL